uniref:GlcG/HbpS family heme-binding protein n=1 Tax=Alicyclobacillus tolerans TaxID=90970 RepID=UPI0027E19868|nr:heme-binding protein [Alicyclobacillus tolerans]
MDQAFEKQSIRAGVAEKMIYAAVAKAEEIGVPMVIAVVDESGVLKAFRRMDGTALLSVDIAQNKAWTAVSFGISTDGWYEFIKNTHQHCPYTKADGLRRRISN